MLHSECWIASLFINGQCLAKAWHRSMYIKYFHSRLCQVNNSLYQIGPTEIFWLHKFLFFYSGILFEMQFPQLNHPSRPLSPLRAVFAAVSAICAINLFFHAIIVRIVRIIVRTASISEIEFLQNSSQSQSLTSPPSIMTSFSLCL